MSGSLCQARVCTCTLGMDQVDGICQEHKKTKTEIVVLCVAVPIVGGLVLVYVIWKLMKRQRRVKPRIRMSHWVVPEQDISKFADKSKKLSYDKSIRHESIDMS